MPAVNLEGDERYFEDDPEGPVRAFDAGLLAETLKRLPMRKPLAFAPDRTVADAIRAMQREQRGCVLVTADGTHASAVLGIFSDRDVLHRVVETGRDPAALPLSEVMTADPECLSEEASIAWVLNKMAVGRFRHVPVVNAERHPQFVVSVRDVVDFLVEFFPREILNLPPEFGRPKSVRPEGA